MNDSSLPAPRTSWRRRAAFRLAALTLALLLLEGGLQVAAYIIWLTREDHETSSDTAGGALCVGDSFTYGRGASEPRHSYPAQAERRMAASTGRHLAFVNRGWPGQTSRDVLAHLPDQLRRLRPRWVYVLVGTNDFPLRPGRLDQGQRPRGGSDSGFPLRWRTARLVLLICDALRPEESRNETPKFVGNWHVDQLEVQFTRDGRLVVGGTEYRWYLHHEQLMMRMPKGWELPIQWHIVGSELRLQCSAWGPTPFALARGSAPATDLHRGWTALRAGDHASARRAFLVALASGLRADSAREGLVLASLGLGEAQAAEEHLAALRDRFAASGDIETGDALAHALAATGRNDEALTLACQLVEAAPPASRSLELLRDHAPDSDRLPDVVTRLERMLRGLDPADPSREALLWTLFSVLRSSDSAASARYLVELVLEVKDEDQLESKLRAESALPLPRSIDGIAAGMALSEPQRSALRHFFERVTRDASGPAGILEYHLGEIVRLCGTLEARPVLLTYPGGPFARPATQAAIRRAAAFLQVDLIDLQPVFDDLVAMGSEHDYFAPDGHCSDRGYAEIARLVTEHAARSLR